MSHDPLKQRLPLEDTVDLAPLGYDAGSEALVVSNPTKALAEAWNATYSPASPDIHGEELDAYYRKQDQERYRLLPYMVKRVTLVKNGERFDRELLTAADTEAVDEVAGLVLQFLPGEIKERGEARVLAARNHFRALRRESLATPARPAVQAPTATNGDGSG